MSLLSDVRGWWRLGNAAPAVQNAAPVPISQVTQGSALFEDFVGSTRANLPVVTERTALMISAVYACVNLISGAISALPMNLFARKRDGERDQLEDDPFWWVLNQEFSGRWAASAGWEFLAASKLLHGDGFARILRDRARPVGLVPLHPLRVRVAPWADGSRLAYVVTPEFWEADQRPQVLDQADMLHIPGFGFDGLRSLSPLRWSLQQAGGVALAAQQFSAQFFANSARPDYALTTDGELKEDQIALLRAQVDEKHSRASGNLFRPMILQGGLKLSALQLTNEDAELIATRGFQIEEIARVFGVPPFMVGHNEKTTSWGSGVSEMGTAFVRYTLRTHLNAFQNEINRKIFRTPDRVAEFDTFELERGDMKGMFEAFRLALGRAGEPGFLSVNEVRKFIHRNRVTGGEDLNPGQTAGAPDAQQTAEPVSR